MLNQDRSSKSTAHLPSAYTSVPPAALRTRNFNVPVVKGPVRPTNFLATAAPEKEEYRWLNMVKAAIEKQAVDKDFLVCLPCKRSSCDHSTSSNPCPFASVHRKRPFDSHVTPLHGYDQSSSPVPEPRASTYPNS